MAHQIARCEWTQTSRIAPDGLTEIVTSGTIRTARYINADQHRPTVAVPPGFMRVESKCSLDVFRSVLEFYHLDRELPRSEAVASSVAT